MRSTNCLKIKELQKNVKNIRNICILAHVDHGKTTLADALIASNGIISNRLAGKLRYMDSREDEQIRGITMKSSGIALHYCHADDQTDYLINLIDSPGHVDFSSEVCTAVRLCDGAIIVVDVVEGVCPQTHAVLRQAWLEKLKPVLVLNKIDRLITEMQCTPLEAHIHLQQVLEQVNAITAGLYSADVLEKTAQNADTKTNTKEASMEENMVFDWASGLDDTDDSSLYFCPHQGNVIFASATDGWGFRIQQFARIFSAKLGIRENALCKTLWGDYYVNQKAKKILKGAQLKAKKPLFVQFILENLWALYDAVLTRKDHERTTKITESLNLKISARDVRVGKSEPKAYLHTICSQWLPLSNAVLASVCEQLPSPCSILEERVEGLMCGPTKSFSSLPPQTQAIKQDFMECDASSDTIIVLVSKMVAVDRKHLPQNRQRMLTSDELRERREAARLRHSEREKQQKQETLHLKAEPQCDEDSNSSSIPKPADNPEHPAEPDQSEEFIAFARVFSGTVRIGQRLFVLGPKFDPSKVDPNQSDAELVAANSHISVAEVKSIYNWMGRELEESDAASAGSIVGIGGLEDHVLNTATLCSTTACPSFNALLKDSAPILRVAVEPKLLSEMGSLVEGLKRLNQADPCVQVMVQDTGEHVIIAAGEVHLQRCLDDLRQRFCKIELDASKPIVPFRETIITRPKFDVMNELIGTQQKNMLQKWCAEESSNKDSNEGDGANEGAGNSNAATKQQRGDDKKNHKLGAVTVQTPNKQCTLRIRAVPLPSEVTKLLEENSHLLQVITSLEKGTKDAVFQRRRRLESTGSTSSSRGIGQQEKAEDDVADDDDAANDDDDESDIFAAVRRQLHVNAAAIERLRQLRADLSSAFDRAGRKWAQASDRLWSFGPRGNGPNALLNHVADYPRPSVWSALGGAAEADAGAYREFDHSVVSGFQLAALSGPLCDEPLHGVCFVVERWDNVVDDVVDDVSTGGSGDPVTAEERAPTAVTFDVPEAHDPAISRQAERHDYGPISGQLISTTKEACKRAFQAQPQRLMAAMYTCDVQATADVLGKVYAVIGRREGRVVSEDLRDGTNVFNVVAVLPVAESFGFADEIRKRTSGLASPQLVFSHWEVVASDPFWVPTTEEEVQHFGEKADFENQACKYMNSVRRRKGLFVEEKTVEHAEKQRTLTRNK